MTAAAITMGVSIPALVYALMRLGFPPHVVEKVLAHTSGTIRGVAAVYNRFAYMDERRAALEAWGRHVDNLVTPALRRTSP
jgi:hypothetical protein